MKRFNSEEGTAKSSKINENDQPFIVKDSITEDVEMGDFEDPYGDDFESEEEVFEAGENGVPDEEAEKAEEAMETQTESRQRVYLPHRSAPLGPDEQMEADPSTYVMLQSFGVKWPCLSFSIIPDTLGSNRKKFPHEMYMVSGSQATKQSDNELNVIKLSSLSKTQVLDNSDDEEDEDDDIQLDPVLESRDIPTGTTINRVRASNINAGSNGRVMAAAMCENSEVQIYDLTSATKSLEKATGLKWDKKPVHVIKNHKTEGYALDWSKTGSTSLLTGDCNGKIHWTQINESSFVTDKAPFSNPIVNESIEELQWSPVESTVFSSAGSDGHIRIWDTRQQPRKPALSVKVTDVDINVMSWNAKASHLLATGHDDGIIAVWDLRSFSNASPVAKFDFHKRAITSIEWNPNDETVLACGSEDSTVSLWDLSVEADDEDIAEQKRQTADLEDVPPQLLFLHWQPNVKEVHWHPQIPGMLASTGSDGFSIWKSISV